MGLTSGISSLIFLDVVGFDGASQPIDSTRSMCRSTSYAAAIIALAFKLAMRLCTTTSLRSVVIVADAVLCLATTGAVALLAMGRFGAIFLTTFGFGLSTFYFE